MNEKFVMRSGKYAGKTVEWLQENDPMYLLWVEENQPNMLKESIKETKSKVLAEAKPQALKPNTNFYNEPPEAQSLKYYKEKGIDVDKVKEVVGKHNIINKAFEEGKDIDPDLIKDFVSFPINDKPKTEDDEWNF